jgi:hypothetical protein
VREFAWTALLCCGLVTACVGIGMMYRPAGVLAAGIVIAALAYFGHPGDAAEPSDGTNL